MRRSIRPIPFTIQLICSAAFAASLVAQEPAGDTTAWSIEEIHGPGVEFDVTLDEGTWMSLDVSPDGQTIVFDLLGDLYTLPITGGTATRITSGPAFDKQPRFSPDGTRIVFVSDRTGSRNIWLANPDGTEAKALTKEKTHGFASPDWSADGEYIVVRKESLTDITAANELHMFHRDGGKGFRIATEETNPSGPVASPDGRWIYFSTGAPIRSGGATIKRHDLRTGDVLPLTGGYGGAVRPTLSPDGTTMAFGRRLDGEEVLVLRNLDTGTERVAYAPLDRDDQETRGPAGRGDHGGTDMLPGFSFAPDGASMVLSAHGKIRRVDLATGRATIIPFSARFQQTLTQKVAVPSRIDDGPVHLRLLRWTHASPDGKHILFSAAGKNYLYEAARDAAVPFAELPGLQYAPAVSSDGEWVAFVNWQDDEGGHVYRAPLRGSGSPVRLTTNAGHYEHPAWSSDGTKLVVLMGSGGEFRGGTGIERQYYEVRWLDATREGPAHFITAFEPRGIRRQAVRPSFNAAGDRVYFSESEMGGFLPKHTDLVSIRLDGTDKRRHLRFTFADDIIPSPDDSWVAFTEQHNVYLVPFPTGGDGPVEVKLEGGSLPVSKLSEEGGSFVNWSPDGTSLTWGWGPQFYRLDLADARAGGELINPDTTSIDVTIPRSLPEGRVLLSGARIVTMADGEGGVIERGDILVEGNRIAAVGPSGMVEAPSDARVIDVRGKTVIPGFIDLHAHYRDEDTEIYPERNWALIAQLAYGVTTIRDVSVRSQTIFTLAEMVETGRTLGPRVYSTGDIIFGWDVPFSNPVKSPEDASKQVRRLKALGATVIKQYMQRRREQRQWVVEAARAENIAVTSEGGGDTFFDLTMVMDGHSGIEHAIPTAPLYRDVVSLLARAGTDYVPTLIVGYGGPTAETYFYQVDDVHDDVKLRRFTPHGLVDEKARRRQLIPEEDYHFKAIAKAAADILHAGGNVGLGAHGNRQGLGAHWELWALAMGGLTPVEALRTATTIPARAMGFDRDIGTLEAGKLADLIVLDANPLDDIRNTAHITYVMKNGVLWNGETMDEVWPRQKNLEPFFWERYSERK